MRFEYVCHGEGQLIKIHKLIALQIHTIQYHSQHQVIVQINRNDRFVTYLNFFR